MLRNEQLERSLWFNVRCRDNCRFIEGHRCIFVDDVRRATIYSNSQSRRHRQRMSLSVLFWISKVRNESALTLTEWLGKINPRWFISSFDLLVSVRNFRRSASQSYWGRISLHPLSQLLRATSILMWKLADSSCLAPEIKTFCRHTKVHNGDLLYVLAVVSRFAEPVDS